jgi:hypothetical protein
MNQRNSCISTNTPLVCNSSRWQLCIIHCCVDYEISNFHTAVHFGTIGLFDIADEEWNEQPSEGSLFLVQPTAGGRSCSSSSWRGPGTDLSLPRARRVHSSGIESPSSPVTNIAG